MPSAIGEAVVYTDLDSLTTEHCELLLKFIPTKEEVCCSTFAVREALKYDPKFQIKLLERTNK